MVNFLAFLIIAIPVFAFINFIDIERKGEGFVVSSKQKMNATMGSWNFSVI